MGDLWSCARLANWASLADLPRLRRRAQLLPLLAPRLQASSKFVLIPGPGDLGPGCSLPRPGVPQAVAAPLLEAVPNAVLASNPCRWVGLGAVGGKQCGSLTRGSPGC